MIDAGTAAKEHYAIGDPVVISTLGEKHTYELTGTASFGDTDSLGFATIAAWDLKTSQQLLDREGQFDTISIAAKEGTSPTELVDAIKPLIPDTLQVQDSAKQAEEDAKDLNSGMDFLRYALLGFGGIALFVGAFVIFNTLSITVAQRTREFATLRTLGASRKQVMRSVRLEGLVIGLIASVIGLVLGLGIAKGMIALFSAFGVDLPEGGTVFQSRTVIVSILLGTGITLLASILPARRATRVPPIAAVREGAVLPTSRFAAHSAKAGVGVVVGSLAAISAGIFAGGVSGIAVAALLGGGVLGLFLGIALLAPRLVGPLARVVGWPAKRVGGVAGELAGANSVRNPGRTASTAAALMVGLTLVTVVAVLGAGLRDSQEGAVREQLHAGYVVDGKQQEPFRAEEGEALARMPGVTAASHVRSDTVLVGADELQITGIDPATITQFLKFDWTKGSEHALAQLGADGAVVTKDYAKDEHLKLGDRISITTASGEKSKAVLRGTYQPPKGKTLLGDVSISQKGFDAIVSQPKNMFTFLDADDSAAAGLKTAVADFGDATLPHGSRVSEGQHQGHGDAAGDALRPARVLGHREPVRHGQHPRALGLRAHAGAGHAAHDRHDAAPGAPHDPAREHHHGADRRCARARARRVPRRARDPGDVRLGREPGAAGPDAGGLHARRRAGRGRRGDHAGTPGLAAQRARRAALRVDDDDRDAHAVRHPRRLAAHAAGRRAS